jgi:hypothetical protein
MQGIYLAPFVLLSVVAGAVCLMVPRWRRHALTAAIAPLAFAICSIVGVLVAVLTINRLVSASIDRIWGYGIAFVVYVASGLAGAWVACAISTARRAKP